MDHESCWSKRLLHCPLENGRSRRCATEFVLNKDLIACLIQIINRQDFHCGDCSEKIELLGPRFAAEEAQNSRTEPGQVRKNHSAIRERSISNKECSHMKKIVAELSGDIKKGK